jgi:hypothetical protein
MASVTTIMIVASAHFDSPYLSQFSKSGERPADPRSPNISLSESKSNGK